MRQANLTSALRFVFLRRGVVPILSVLLLVFGSQAFLLHQGEARRTTELVSASIPQLEQAILKQDYVALSQGAKSLSIVLDWDCAILSDSGGRILGSHPRRDWIGLDVGQAVCGSRQTAIPLSTGGKALLNWREKSWGPAVKVLLLNLGLMLGVLAVLGLLFGSIATRARAYLEGVEAAVAALGQDQEAGGTVRMGTGDAGDLQEIRTIREALVRRVALEQQIRKEQEERARVESRAELALQVAHDIRSPLGALKAVSAGLQGGAPEVRELLSVAIGRITGIAESLLEERKSHFLPIKDWFETLLSEKRTEWGARGTEVRLEGEIAPGCDRLTPALDIVSLQRVLSNLINNSYEALAGVSGSILVKVDCAVSEAGKQNLLLSIHDSGPGFGAGPFKPESHGLGVTGARIAAEKAGGKLEILERGPLGGASVSVILPLANR